MDTQTFRFDGDALMSTMAAAFVHRLKDRGVSFSQAQQLAAKAAERLASRVTAAQSKVAESTYLLVLGGSEAQGNIDSNASAVFAVAGVEAADEVFLTLVAESN